MKEIALISRRYLERVSRGIFGHFEPVNFRTGRKYLQRRLKGENLKAYYDVIKEKSLYRKFRAAIPDFQTVEEEDRLEKLDLRKKYGKGPPKKGQGKRKK